VTRTSWSTRHAHTLAIFGPDPTQLQAAVAALETAGFKPTVTVRKDLRAGTPLRRHLGDPARARSSRGRLADRHRQTTMAAISVDNSLPRSALSTVRVISASPGLPATPVP